MSTITAIPTEVQIKPNVDPSTGVAFGVLPAYHIDPDILDMFQDKGENLTYKEWLSSVRAEYDEKTWNRYGVKITETRAEEFLNEECFYSYEDITENLKLGYCTGQNVIIVFKSRRIVHTRQCSPCYPNAGDLSHRVENGFGVACYDLPTMWYTVDSVRKIFIKS